jgi:hypothetical protein
VTTALAMTHPTILHLPTTATSSAGQEAVDLARLAGLELDPWQAFILEHAMAERPDGRWAAFEVALEISRQNGKGGVLEARELAGLFLILERLLVHSAHEFATSREHQQRLEFLIQNTPEIHQRVRAYKHAHGEEGIYLKNGNRLLFRTRTKGGGRGFSADFVGFDESMFLPESTVGALLPTLSARPNPQVWYAGSAVDKMIHPDGVVFARLRERALAGEDEALAYFGWEFRPEGWEGDFGPSDVTPAMAADPESWAQANPALDIRISREHVGNEHRTMDPRTFAVERLGVGDWPETDPEAGSVINLGTWRSLLVGESRPGDALHLAFDTTPDRAWSSIVIASPLPGGAIHLELVDRRPGTGWLRERIPELRDRHRPQTVRCDEKGPAATVAEDVGAETISAADYVKACGTFFDLVDEHRVQHLGQSELDAAIRGAATRPLGDAWAWSRKSSSIDVSPLVAGTIAVDAAAARPRTSAWAGAW